MMALLFAARLRAASLAVVASAAVVSLLFPLPSSAADGFRISTKIYVGEEDSKDSMLVSESTTLFLDGAVYDFLADGSQTAVFRKPAGKEGRFILLNPDQRMQTEFTTKQVAGAIDGLRSWAASHKQDEMLQFAAHPKFDETYEQETGRLVLASHLQTYTVTTKPVEHAEAIAEYREFLNWYTQLNTLLQADPTKLPRMQLNEVLAHRRLVPQVVELTRAGDKQPTRAVHEFTMRLSRDDMAKIDEVRASLASFRSVPAGEFRKATYGLSQPK
jgi:hypothetical protein